MNKEVENLFLQEITYIMKRFKDITPEDVELYNRSRNDIICFAAKEIAIFLCAVACICILCELQVPAVLPWICIGLAVALVIFAIVWDGLITAGKVKSRRGKFLWLILAIQGIAITLLFLLKSNASVIIISVLVLQLLSLALAMMVRPKSVEK